MSILITPETKILIQGITGAFGARHAQLSLDYGTQVVAGVTPGKGGQFFEYKQHRIPIFNSVADAVAATGATVSAIFVPPPFAADAILECVGCRPRSRRRHHRGHSGTRHGARETGDGRPEDAPHRAQLPRSCYPRQRSRFLRRLPHRHRPGLHSQEGPRRHRFALRHPHV